MIGFSEIPTPDELSRLFELAISPSFPGNLYEIRRLVDSKKHRAYAIKTLKPDALEHYPEDITLKDVFAIHQYEHQIFLRHLKDFVLPSLFYEESLDGKVSYKICQPWVEHGVQYKEAIKYNRSIPPTQMPELEERIRFIENITSLYKDQDVYPRIADLDFFIYNEGADGKFHIVITDTNFLWYPKLPNDSRKRYHELTTFLFSPEELKLDSIKSTLAVLGNSLNFGQID